MRGRKEVPKAGIRDALTGLRRYFRPGTARSPLRELGDRFFVDAPGLPKLLVTCSPDDAKAMFTERDGGLSSARRSTGSRRTRSCSGPTT